MEELASEARTRGRLCSPRFLAYSMTSTRRVLHLIPTLSLGGAELFVERLARAQRGSAFEPIVCAMHRGGPVEARLERARVPCFRLDVERASVRRPWRAAADARALIRGVRALVREQAVDVLQTHLPDADWLGLYAARRERIPCVMTFHNPTLRPQDRRDGDLRTRMRRVLQSRTYRRADALIAVSADVKQALCAVPGVRAERVHVVHSGIEPRPPIGAAERAELARRHASLLDGRAPVLLSAGRLVESKGHDLVLDTLPLLCADHARLALWIAGDGPCAPALAERARTLGVAEHVRWLGSRDDLAELYPLADVFVTGSRFEGLGLAAAEAQQAGVPVAGFAVSGLSDVVADGETGLLVADGDVRALAEAVRALLADPARRERMGAAGRARSARFEIEHAARATEAIYRRVLD